MKITHIETIALRDPGKYDETIVRVHTDEGLSGIGQAESPSLVIDAIIHCHGGLEDILRGEDPTQVERLWQKMYDRTGLFGRRGVTIAAIGAVETALWDIAGQAAGVPVCELIWRAFATTKCSHRDQAPGHALRHGLPAGRDAGRDARAPGAGRASVGSARSSWRSGRAALPTAASPRTWRSCSWPARCWARSAI